MTGILLLAMLLVFGVMPVARTFGYGVLVVRGDSMGGSYSTGSLVFARLVEADEVRPGDVVVVQETVDGIQATPKLHRILSLEVDGDELLARTKGDANQAADPKPYVLPDRVATASSSVPYAGYLVGAVTTPLGWLLGVALPASVLCFLVLRSIWLGGGLGEPRAKGIPRRAPGTS
jgi:signal peptidase